MSNTKNFFRASAEDFKKIPGSPVAYWVSEVCRDNFANLPPISNLAPTSTGMKTGDNNRFVREWWEISSSGFQIDCYSSDESLVSSKKWFPYNKGGAFRKWYGNNDFVINWHKDGYDVKHLLPKEVRHYQLVQKEWMFKPHVTWTKISSATSSFRIKESGTLFDMAGASIIPSEKDILGLLAFCNSYVALKFLQIISSTINYQSGDIGRLPYAALTSENRQINLIAQRMITISKSDWNSYETSWDFERNPLVAMRQNPVNPVNPVEKSDQLSVARGQEEKTTIAAAHCTRPTDHSSLPAAHSSLATLYAQLRQQWAASCEEMRRLETENNRIFIEAYGLQDELKPDVPWNEITLTCNPWYRYGETAPNGGSNEFPIDAELESRLKGDTVKELISYAVGCMMGRYSIDKPGLILADQGATLQDFLAKVPSPSYGVDEDGIIPILDNDWFADDIVTRFKEFVKVVFGEEHYFENMAWIEDALGKDIRSYFTKDFYKDHLQRYQNRPIYWLFQSPKGAFRALVYMHRYKPDMVGGVLGYLRSLQTKIDNQLDVAMQIGMDESKSVSERVRANKDAVRFAKTKKELDEYERNVLYPLSTERIEIDLDDGVKVNYRKFGSALRKVAALEGKGE